MLRNQTKNFLLTLQKSRLFSTSTTLFKSSELLSINALKLKHLEKELQEVKTQATAIHKEKYKHCNPLNDYIRELLQTMGKKSEEIKKSQDSIKENEKEVNGLDPYIHITTFAQFNQLHHEESRMIASLEKDLQQIERNRQMFSDIMKKTISHFDELLAPLHKKQMDLQEQISQIKNEDEQRAENERINALLG